MLNKSVSMLKINFLRCKNIVNIVTFNVRTINIINQLLEFTASAAEHNTDIICVKRRYILQYWIEN